MASYKSAVFAALFVFFSFVKSEVEDLQPLVTSTEETLQHAKTHVEHMLNLNPVPNEGQLHPVLENETEHLAYEMKKLSTKLHEVIGEGIHKPEVKEAAERAATHLHETANTLTHEGSDLKQINAKYYEAAEKELHELKAVLAVGPCEKLNPVVKAALKELKHDVDNYQHGIHHVVGPHEGGPEDKGHHEHNHEHGHGHHKHHGSSSEENKEQQVQEWDHGHHLLVIPCTDSSEC